MQFLLRMVFLKEKIAKIAFWIHRKFLFLPQEEFLPHSENHVAE